MKKILIAAMMILPVVSCTKKLVVPADPSNIDEGRTEVTASVQDYIGQRFVWTASTRIGIYDSEGHSNQRYTLKNEYLEKSGEVSLYGSTIGGTMVAYMPYTEKGYPCVAEFRQPVLAEQKAGASELSHLVLNTVLVARGDEQGRFQFSYEVNNVGLIHFTVMASVDGLVDKVVIHCPDAPLAGNVSLLEDAVPRVTEGSQYLTLTDVDRPCTDEAPLEVWAQVPSGVMSHLTITLESEGNITTAVHEGSITVPSGGAVSVVAERVANQAGNDDLTIIDGYYQ